MNTPQFLSTQPYKGTRDFYPTDMRVQQWMFEKLKQTVKSFGYQEYDGPLLEPIELYAAKSGEELVNQQLYSFMDRGDRKVAIRPEMTPTLARMVAGKFHELPKPIRWFTLPNFYRYERPQRGRLREFWQLNVDLLGGNADLADTEIIELALRIMEGFGGLKHSMARINNRRLMEHFFSSALALDSATALKASKLIDAKAKLSPEAYLEKLSALGLSLSQIERLETFFKMSFSEIESTYPCQGTSELRALFDALNSTDLKGSFMFDAQILRGLDYYTGTVFEIFDQSPENPRAIFGGGRYDNLLGLFGKFSLPGMGFGMGDVTLKNFLETHKLLPTFKTYTDVYLGFSNNQQIAFLREIAQSLRKNGLKAQMGLEVETFGTQIKQALKHEAKAALLIGEAEYAEGKVLIKNLSKNEQESVLFADVIRHLKNLTND